MNILVTGSGGQLGSEFQAVAATYPECIFFFYDHSNLDICDGPAVETAMETCRPDVVINCAAYTSVDNCEKNPVLAYSVNRDGAALLAENAKRHGTLLLHVSSYYVFDGCSGVPYKETDQPNPEGVYALSKFQGEELIRNSGASFLIVRAGWLYSSFGKNFVKTILRYSKERESIKVVFDRVGSPVYAGDFARAIISMLNHHKDGDPCAATYHLANEGVCSWYDFAESVVRFSGLSCKVLPVESSDFPVQGPRPWYSVLNNAAIKRDYGLEIPWWQDSLERLLLKNSNGLHYR